ncbi:MAG TPA: 50S ribosomal protein L6 [Nitrososphaeraceae archaeon]|nr:50S ribosomal protein L6 [Nitrososphaeraceae archaeon]
MATSTKQEIFAEIEIPENVKVRMEGNVFIVDGKLGSLRKDITKLPVAVDVKDKKLVVRPPGTRKKDLAVTNTVKSIIQSMIKGVETGYTYKLKVVYAHFPISVKTKGREIHVENYFGERAPRVSHMVGDSTKVNVIGEDVIVQGPSLEDVSQTAANIEFSTKLKGKDQRVFLDGLYIYSRQEGMS